MFSMAYVPYVLLRPVLFRHEMGRVRMSPPPLGGDMGQDMPGNRV